MTLWSVEDSQSAMMEPLRALRGGVTAAWAGLIERGHCAPPLPSAVLPAGHGSTR